MTSPPSKARPWIAPVTPDLVWFRGSDALTFLNDLISQEISNLGEGEVTRSFLLGPDGKLGHVLWVTRSGDSIGLITDPGRGEELADQLSRYRIRVDVEIVPEARPMTLIMGEWEGLDVSWGSQQRTLVIGERPDLDTGSYDEYELSRIDSGEPAWGHEIEEGTIPHETGLVADSVDFDKGCFLGQELVARMDSRGAAAPKRVVSLEIDTAVAEGAQIEDDGGQVGVVTSAVGRSALGVVKRSVMAGDQVRIGDVAAEVREIPQKARR